MRIRRWLDQTVAWVPPKSLLGQAIAYALGQWPILITFLDDAHLEVDNNRTENAIRPLLAARAGHLASLAQDRARSRRGNTTYLKLDAV
jgi:transposase